MEENLKFNFKEGEESKPANERTIQQTGAIVEFSFIQTENDSRKFEKQLLELNGNRNIQAGVVSNVETHHPFVKEMEDADLFAAHMYQEAKSKVKAYDLKIAEIEAAYVQHKADIEKMKEALPELAVVVSPLSNEGGEVVEQKDEAKEDEQKTA